MKAGFIEIIVLAIAVFAVATLLPGIKLKKPTTAIWVAVVYALLNSFFFELLALLAFPIMFITLGLFTFVINAFLLFITDKLVDDFEIKSAGTTLLAAFLISIFKSFAHWLI